MGFWNDLKKIFTDRNSIESEAVGAVQKIIGYSFREPYLLIQALTHRSYLHQKDETMTSNERFEFLGDSVLGLVIADKLFQDHDEYQEGKLTKTKAMMVNEITLAKVGREIGLNKYILLSPEEEKLGGRERPSIISDAFESIIGAVYLDGGYKAAGDVILRLIYTRKEYIVNDEAQINFKGELLEMLQAHGRSIPRYEVVTEKGPDHAKEFTVVVIIDGEKIGTGVGFTKKEAEQRAASVTIDILKNI